MHFKIKIVSQCLVGVVSFIGFWKQLIKREKFDENNELSYSGSEVLKVGKQSLVWAVDLGVSNPLQSG